MKHLLIIVLVLIQFSVLSQSLDGKFQLGGSASYYSSNTDYERNSDIDSIQRNGNNSFIAILPQFGYFINDKISIGGQIGYRNQTSYNYYQRDQDAPIENKIKSNILSIGTFARIHKSINENLYLFLQGDIGVGFGKEENDTYAPNNRNHFDFRAGIQPGILYMVSEKMGIEAKFGFLGYNSSKYSLDDSNDELYEKHERFGLELSPNNFALGLQFYL